MIETKPIPALAQTAYSLALASFQRLADRIGVETVAALGLSEADNWTVNFDTGEITREIPDPPKAPQEPSP